MAKSKYIGMIVDGYWEVIDCIATGKNDHYKYVLKNKYNGREVEILDNTMIKIVRGETGVSRTIAKRIRNERTIVY